jgi:cytosine/adenosine deaminase-related metal-dependent hydrolase
MFGKNPLAVMEEVDFLGEDVFFAHGVYFNDTELETLARTKTSIAHCPSSNMRLGSGVARIKDMLRLGINVGLAVDGSASNDTSDMLGELRNALLLQRVKYGADALTSRDVFKMATVNGAQMLNFPNTGKIKEGYLADLAVFNLNKLEYTGSLSDPLAALIFSGISHEAKYTIVNGRVVVENGWLVGEDEEYLMKKGNEASRKLLSKLK